MLNSAEMESNTMFVFRIFLIAIVWLAVGALVMWNGAGWVLGQTSIEVLQDDAVKMIVQIVAVCLGSGTFAGFMTWLTILLLSVFGSALEK